MISSCQSLIIISCLQTPTHGSNEAYKVSDHARRHYLENQKRIEGEMFNVFEVEPIKAIDLREIMIAASHTYEMEMLKEIDLMTQVIDA